MDPHKPDREVWCNTGNLVENINRLNLLLKYIPEVCTGPGKHWKKWNFIISFSRPGESLDLGLALGKSWKVVENELALNECKDRSKVEELTKLKNKI